MTGQLPISGVHKVLDCLHQQNRIEWCDKLKKSCFIYWRTPEEWGKLIYQYIVDNGMNNTVCTLFELTKGDDVANEGNSHTHCIHILNIVLQPVILDS